ncbi:hypothetical protein GCM10010149_83460 [Nonomuraea roseoviolacea subsp. roseoviolacea]
MRGCSRELLGTALGGPCKCIFFPLEILVVGLLGDPLWWKVGVLAVTGTLTGAIVVAFSMIRRARMAHRDRTAGTGGTGPHRRHRPSLAVLALTGRTGSHRRYQPSPALTGGTGPHRPYRPQRLIVACPPPGSALQLAPHRT